MSSLQTWSFNPGLHKMLSLVAAVLLKHSPKALPQDVVGLSQTAAEPSKTTSTEDLRTAHYKRFVKENS